MPAIPPFILKKLYIAGSLRNLDGGCQLQLQNTLAPATITGVGPVTIDGVQHSSADVVLQRGGESLPASDVSPQHPMRFDINAVVTITVKNAALAPGEHRIALDINSREAGHLKWDVSDSTAR